MKMIFASMLGLLIAAAGIDSVLAQSPPPLDSLGQQTIFTTQTPQFRDFVDSQARSYELGINFTPIKGGVVTAIRYWKANSESAVPCNGCDYTHKGTFWPTTPSAFSVANNAFFRNESAEGWQTAVLPVPTRVIAGQSYSVSVGVQSHYVATLLGLQQPIANGALVANQAGGVYGDLGVRPTSTYNAANYFVDVVFAATDSIQAVNAGGPARTYIREFVEGFNEQAQGVGTISTEVAIDRSAVDSPPPEAVYQTARAGLPSFQYPIAGGNLVIGTQYRVRLHFAELVFSQPGRRRFNLFVGNSAANRSQLLADFDIVANAGGPYKAVVKEFTLTAEAYRGTGAITLFFESGSNSVPLVNAIEILPVTSQLLPPSTKQAPTVSITSPINNASVTVNTQVSISANAADSDGTIAKVDFYANGIKIRQENLTPYSFNWTPTSAGAYTITAKATDDKGATTTSAAVSVTVTPVTPTNQPPTVSITAPINNASFTVNSVVNISANAADSDGNVAKVEFFFGATKIGEDTSSPYAIAWTPTLAGSDSLTARVTDNQNAVTTSTPVNVTVTTTTSTLIPPDPACTVTPCQRNYFVDGNIGIDYGTPSATNGTFSKPYKTPAKVAKLVNPGDTVYLKDSNTPYIGFLLERSGSPGHDITFRAYPGHKPEVKVENQSYIFYAIALGHKSGSLKKNVSYITIDGLVLTGNNAVSASGTYVESALTAAKADRNAAGSGNGPLNASGIMNTDSRDSVGTDNYSHHITIKNNVIRNFGCNGISLTGDYFLVENNLVYQNGWYSRYGCSGISLFTTRNFDNTTFKDTSKYRIQFVGNKLWNNASYVPYIGGGQLTDGNGIIVDVDDTHLFDDDGKLISKRKGYKGRILIANNLAVNNGGAGLHIYFARNVDVINNTAYKNGAFLTGYPDMDANAATDVRFINNVVFGAAGHTLMAVVNPKDSKDITFESNLLYDGTLTPTIAIPLPTSDVAKDNNIKRSTNDIIGDPLFVNPGMNLLSKDFSFKLTSPSKAINSGVSKSNVTPATDLDKVSRPQGGAIDRGAYEFVPASQ
jgi:parallel beta-helix repeat protein